MEKSFVNIVLFTAKKENQAIILMTLLNDNDFISKNYKLCQILKNKMDSDLLESMKSDGEQEVHNVAFLKKKGKSQPAPVILLKVKSGISRFSSSTELYSLVIVN